WQGGASSRSRQRGWSRKHLSEDGGAALEVFPRHGERRNNANHRRAGREHQQMALACRGDDRRRHFVELEPPHQTAASRFLHTPAAGAQLMLLSTECLPFGSL